MGMMEKYHLGNFPSFPFFKWQYLIRLYVRLNFLKKGLMGLLHLNFHSLNVFFNYLE
jgi:hypothetical protein